MVLKLKSKFDRLQLRLSLQINRNSFGSRRLNRRTDQRSRQDPPVMRPLYVATSYKRKYITKRVNK